MNIQVLWNGADITNSVVEYSREHNICNGEGTLDMNVEAKTARDFMPWDTVVIYENGDKVHTYNIAAAEEQIPGLIYVVTCQDDSKRLTDYFIDEQYIIDYPSTARYWIEKFLTDADVTYNFNTDSYGNALSENTTLGMTSAYDAIIQLLQLCGWYFYFDNNNVCQIGKLSVNSGSTVTFTGSEILEIGYLKNDKMLRNRAVVWGAGDPDTGQWIFADTSTLTPWNRDAGDYRTIVYANPIIKTFAIAYSLAYIILNEFSQTIPEKTIVVAGSHSDVNLGTVVEGVTSKLTAKGKVTHIVVNMSSQGLISTYTLDQRCPRLFGYAEWIDYVYIGTHGNGVWRKYLTSNTWSNYSTGITDLNIKDLAAYNGLLGSISFSVSGEPPNASISGELNIRHTSLGSWYQYNPVGFTDYTASGGPKFLTSGIIAEACSIDRTIGINGAIVAGFTIPGSGEWVGSGEYYATSGNLSWIQAIDLNRVPIYTQQIIATSGTYGGFNSSDIAVIDIDTNWEGHNIISVFNGKTKYGPQIPRYSGGMFDYGGPVNRIGIENGYTLLFGDEMPGAGNIIVSMPTTTSGIVVEQTSFNLEELPYSGGFWIMSKTIPNYGGIVIEDDEESDGWAFGLDVNGTSSSITKVHFCLASGIYDSEWIEWNNFAAVGTYYLNFELLNEGQYTFHKIDENNFSIVNINDDIWDIYTVEIQGPDLSFESNIVGSGILTSHEEIVIENYTPILDTESAVGVPHIFSGNRYVGVLYCEEVTSPEYNYKIAVIDSYTGSLLSDNFIATTTDNFEDICVVHYTSVSPNYAYFGLVYAYPAPYDSIRWDGFKVYIILMNRNTGNINIIQQPFTPNMSGDNRFWLRYPYLMGIPWWDGGTNNPKHRPWCFFPANENPDTGEGFGHFYTAVEINYKEELETNWSQLVYAVDIIVYTDGSTKIFGEYANIFPYGNEATIQSPEWMVGWYEVSEWTAPAVIVYPSFSRYVSNSPVLIKNYTHYQPYFVNPSDFTNIVGTPQFPIGYDTIDLLYPMLDDVDDTMYASVSNDGYNPETIGYNFSGTIIKRLFPTYDGFAQYHVYGQPLENKLYYGQENVETIFLTIPTFPVSGRAREASRYLILKHDHTVLPSGLFDIIYQSGYPLKVDTSKDVPTVIYNEPDHDGYDSSILARSFINESDSFEFVFPDAPVKDVRVFDMMGLVLSGGLDRYIGVAGGHLGLLAYNSTLENNDYLVVYSGSFSHLDFTNNFEDPYMFVCTSGTQQVDSGRFFQKDTESFFWNDYSATLPSGIITIIRADDRM